jgi:hypothetical protein
VLVIRVEDGLLSEIESTFTDYVFGGGMVEGGLPVGSVIIVGSVSHLGTRGLGSYAEDLVKTISSVGARVGAGSEVIPLVPVPLGGVYGAGAVRDVFDLDSWIIATGSPGAILRESREILWKRTRAISNEACCLGAERKIFLPASIKNPRKRVFLSPGTVHPLPDCIAPADPSTEKAIVFALIAELNKTFGLQLDPNPSLERGVVTQTEKYATDRFIVVGGSHMVKMAAFMPENTTCLAEPGFRAVPQACERISHRLAELEPDGGDTVILDLLSNNCFMGTTDDGMPAPVFPMTDGRYHVPGSLITTPLSIVRKTLQNCESIVKTAKKARIILVGPSPRYVSGRCCDDETHLENYNSPDYETEILTGIETVNRALEKWAVDHDLDYTLLDPTEHSVPADFPLGERVTPDGSAWWANTDPVHLSTEGYRFLASVFATKQEGGGDTPSIAGSSASTDGGSDAASSGKRKRVDSVVITVPARVDRGRAARRPAWLSGSAESAPNAGRGSRGFRGWNPYWRSGGARGSHGRRGRRGRFGRW